MSKKFKPCLKKLLVCLICRKRPDGHQVVTNEQCPDEIVPEKSTSTTLRNPSYAHKQDSADSLLLKTNQLNCVYM
jgi:hypothetical protein